MAADQVDRSYGGFVDSTPAASYDSPSSSLTGGLFDRPSGLTGSAGDPSLSRMQSLINKSGDQMTMNPSTPEDLGKDPEYLNILGTVMSRSQLEAMDGGKQILDLERRRRTGQRGFWEAATEFGAADIPFAGDVVGVAIPIKEMRKVRSTLEKLDRGDYVDPQDKVYARLYLADAERKSQQGFYGKFGDVVHGLPTLGAEMWLTSQAFAAAAAPFAGGAAATGVGAPAAAATEAAAGLAGALTALGKTGFKAAARAEARKAASEWIKAGIKKSYMDFIPKAVGPDAAKLGWGAATLRGMGEMAITAPIKGAGYAGMDILANAAVNTAMGEDALSSRNEIEKQIAGYLDNNDELTKNARWLALGDKFVEYYTEMAGEGLGELIGLPIRGVARAGFNKIPAMEKYRKTLEAVWGTPAELAERQKKFGAMTPADRSKEISALGMWGLNKMVDHNINPSKVVDFLKDTGYHGWIGEMAEERYAGFLNGLYGSDDGKGSLESAMKNMWPDKDQLMAEAIGFMIPIATLHATARMQNMKALGGKGMFNSSDWAEGAKAGSRVIGASGSVVEIHGEREAAAETPGAVPAEPAAPADPSAPTDTGAPPTTSKKDDFKTFVDFLMENSESDRSVANTKSSVLQRLAKGALRIANVAVTGDFGRMQAGDSVNRYLQDFGINEPFARKMSSFEDEVAKATRDRRIAEATSGGKTLSDEDIKSERFDFELIRASKEVQDAKREFTELLVSAVAAKNGRIALQESRFAEAAKRANVSPEELEKRLRDDVAAGRIAVMSHGDGNKSIVRRTMEGKDAAEEVQRGLETALDEVLGPTRAMQQLHTEALNTIEESVGGMSLNDEMLAGDPDELTKLAIHSARPISRTTQLHDFVKTAAALARSESNAARVRVSHAQKGIQGDVWVRIGEDGKAHVHPFKQRAEDIAAADYIRKDKKFAEQIDLASMSARLGSMGLAPQIVPTEIKFIRPTSFINEDVVRLVHALGYDSREEFSDNSMEEYLRMKTLAEHGPAEQREAARKYVAARWKMAEDSYANQYGGNIENLKSKVDGKEVYKFTVGAFNVPGTVFVVVPPDTGARTSTTSVVEDILEERLKRAYYADGKYRNYHVKYLEKLQDLAVRLSGKYEKPYPKVAKELKAIANLLSAVVLPEKKISYDSLSKPITMLFGHFDASATSGEGVLQASGWSALRQAIMEDAGTEAEPGMRTLTAGFLSKILQDTMGQAGLKNFQEIPSAFFPSGMVKGYETSNRSLFQGKTLAPLRDLETLNTLRKTGEAALDDTVKKALSPDGQDLKESSTGVVPAQAEKDKSKSEKAKADKKRAEADAAAAAPGDPVADAGYPNEVAAKLAYATEMFEEETYEDFLTRKMCMGNNGPYSGGKPTGKPASIRRPKKK